MSKSKEQSNHINNDTPIDWSETARYQRQYRERHPEKVLQWNINKAIRTLQRNGYTIIAPITENGGDDE